MEKLYGDYDPSQLNTSGIEEEQKRLQEVSEEQERLELLAAEEQEKQTAEAAQAMAEVEDPRNKKQWGLNLLKFEGMQMPGGVTFNGRQLYDDAVADLERLEEEARLNWEQPVDFYTG